MAKIVSGTKVTPVDDDSFILKDSEDGNSLKEVSYATLSASFVHESATSVVMDAKVNEATGITKGQVVYVSGATGGSPQVSLADNTDYAKSDVLAIAAETKADNTAIQVIILGIIEGVDTSAFTEGQILYLGTSGGITATHPIGLNAVAIVGRAIKINASTGSISFTVDSLTIVAAVDGFVRNQIVNTSAGLSAIVNTTYVNNLGHYLSINMTGSNNTFGASEASWFNKGYGNSLFINDGNKDFIWHTDVTDVHTQAYNEKMRLSAAGDLTVGRFVSAGSALGVGTSLPNYDMHLHKDINSSLMFTIQNDSTGASAQTAMRYDMDGSIWVTWVKGNANNQWRVWSATANNDLLIVDAVGLTTMNTDLSLFGEFKGDVRMGSDLDIAGDLNFGVGTGMSILGSVGTIYGGTTAGKSLNLFTTTHATKGIIYFGLSGQTHYDEPNDVFRMGGDLTVFGDILSDVSSNTTVGTDAGGSLLTGQASANTALGMNALSTGTTCSYNTAVGINALASNTASENTAVGAYALTANVSGTDMTAIGNDALRLNTSGFGNMALGAYTLRSNLTGNRNTGVGARALQNSLANDNTAIGHNAGNALTSGGNNILIGSGVQASAPTASNEVVIGTTSHTDTWLHGTVHAPAMDVVTMDVSGLLGVARLEAVGTTDTPITGAANIGTTGVVFGSNTLFLSEFKEGSPFKFDGDVTSTTYVVTGVTSDVDLTISPNPTAAYIDAIMWTDHPEALKIINGLGVGLLVVDHIGDVTVGNDLTVIGRLDVGVIKSSGAISSVGSQSTTNSVANGFSNSMQFKKDRAGAVVQNGDELGYFGFYGYDGATYRRGAYVIGRVDTGTISSTSMPVKLGFFTTPDGSLTSVNRLEIKANGDVEVFNNFTAWTYSGNGAGLTNLPSQFNVNTTTNFGVGVTTLDSLTIGINNVAVGPNALTADTTGSFNTAVGTSSLEALIGGDSNTGIGFNALKLVTSGAQNTAIGDSAGANITTGTGNICIGEGSVVPSPTGNNQIVIGDVSAVSTTIFGAVSFEDGQVSDSNFSIKIGTNALAIATGNNNIAFGENALAACTTGSENVAIGVSALTLMVDDSNNIAIGYFAARSYVGPSILAIGAKACELTTDGQYNMGVGVRALQKNIEGDWNTAIGYEALRYTNTTSLSGSNTGIGYRALYLNVTGVRNVALGALAGDTTTSGSNNILIGDGVRASSSSASNETVIGNADTTSAVIKGFVDLGGTGVAIKHKKLTGTTGATEGSDTLLAHGLTQSKILSVSVLVADDAGTLIPPSFTATTETNYDFQVTSTNVEINLSGADSATLLSNAITVLITYEG